ncbi:DHA2 family efflux MFS transporter permease subunit [Pectobacteriaceae bacterium CE70]|uniref:MFS transporter n=1 Tax=Serratia sp. (strain ATCC 39006) TaxID=104623 RepID=A0A2I5T9S9_SERS3|nr:DHA2 family efflux MFS transporter permease subunit [Serratia sp. ATCC 39006]WJV64043.1 DHA2 family efflux MFS transporter permease subunit [Pectobacteriaceae bacterium C52]WJV68455.1 DHA2 family efflux MFS transporter permease subunit [Pectobacteriaceae bacterium CE70]WJY12385.1 DHA2 family efflux MFS transporter permease subunit [Pectobacteriaceae bacterium C80]AUH01330.1 MFS transporter [Serratia sp. ATCC 39006]AUH05651.1 MFS transporter [Serratia sp. ATCC 39006]
MNDKAAFTPPSLALATFAISLATFMQVLDSTIANVSLTTIAGSLGVSSDQSTWVITSFAVCNAISLPLTGWLSRTMGQLRLFIVSVLLFSLASFLCGFAQNMTELIIFRALQGFFAGPMYPMCQTLLLMIFPPSRRNMALALLAMVTVVGPIVGPITGGWITDSYSWSWIFYINVPIGIFASIIVWMQLRDWRNTIERVSVDYIGIGLLVIGVGLLQVVLDKGNDLDWFSSTNIVTMSVISAIALVSFIIWELGERHPIVNLRLFADRNFTVGTLSLMLGYAAFFAINVILPQWLQRWMGYTAIWAGLAAAPMGMLPVILSPIIGRYGNRVDLRLLATVSFVIMGLSCLMRAQFNTNVDFMTIAGVQLFMGMGVAFFFVPLTSILLSSLHGKDVAEGSGLATFLRVLGGSFASSLSTWIWSNREIYHHAILSESVSIYNPAAVSYLHRMGGITQTNLAQLDQTVQQQAWMSSTIDYFHLLGWGFLGLIVVIWFAKPPFTTPGPVSSGH